MAMRRLFTPRRLVRGKAMVGLRTLRLMRSLGRTLLSGSGSQPKKVKSPHISFAAQSAQPGEPKHVLMTRAAGALTRQAYADRDNALLHGRAYRAHMRAVHAWNGQLDAISAKKDMSQVGDLMEAFYHTSLHRLAAVRHSNEYKRLKGEFNPPAEPGEGTFAATDLSLPFFIKSEAARNLSKKAFETNDPKLHGRAYRAHVRAATHVNHRIRQMMKRREAYQYELDLLRLHDDAASAHSAALKDSTGQPPEKPGLRTFAADANELSSQAHTMSRFAWNMNSPTMAPKAHARAYQAHITAMNAHSDPTKIAEHKRLAESHRAAVGGADPRDAETSFAVESGPELMSKAAHALTTRAYERSAFGPDPGVKDAVLHGRAFRAHVRAAQANRSNRALYRQHINKAHEHLKTIKNIGADYHQYIPVSPPAEGTFASRRVATKTEHMEIGKGLYHYAMDSGKDPQEALYHIDDMADDWTRAANHDPSCKYNSELVHHYAVEHHKKLHPDLHPKRKH